MRKQFSKTELKHIKFLLMRKGYNEEQAYEEIAKMIKTVEDNHAQKLKGGNIKHENI